MGPARAQTALPTGRRASLVAGLESGRIRQEAAADTPLVPASTLKLVTAFAALDILGQGHRFVTRLVTDATIADGELHGDLVLHGTGDPLLDADHLFALVLSLRRSGLRRVRGRFLFDESAFPVVPQLSAAEPDWAPWNAGVGPLGVGFDRVLLHERDGQLFTVPPVPLRLRRVPAGAAGPEGIRALRGADGSIRAWLFAADRPLPEALPVDRPGQHAAEVLRWFAAAVGITLPPPARGRAPAAGRDLAAHESPPLREIVRAMLHYSNNQVAERLGLASAARLAGGAPADRVASIQLLAAHLAQRVPGFQSTAAQLLDHCGLDANNRLSAPQLAAVLREGWRRFDLATLLPLAGWSGTLYRRLLAPGIALGVAAKSGSLDYASALAGYVLRPGKEPLLFVLMADDPAARAVYRSRRPPDEAARTAAEAWRRAARAHEKAFVARLVDGE